MSTGRIVLVYIEPTGKIAPQRHKGHKDKELDFLLSINRIIGILKLK
jgi:hypothetical protein